MICLRSRCPLLEGNLISFKGITTILFDLDGTLRHSIPAGQDIFMDFAESLGLTANTDNRRMIGQWAHQYWANSECLMNDKKTFTTENGGFWQNYAKRQFEVLGISSEQATKWAPKAQDHMRENFNPKDIIADDVYETLQVLKDASYKMGLVTNRSNPVDEYLVEKNLKNYFDFSFYAGEIGSWKPEPEIFQHALRLANAEACETIYVGDNYYADVIGARNVNILPVLLDPDNVFPDADCPVILKIGDLQEHLTK